MTNLDANRRVDPDELRELGVPEKVIKETVENAKIGLFAIAPPENVIRKTMDACEIRMKEEQLAKLHRLHKLCSNNRESIEASHRVGCFYCEKIFQRSKVEKYVGRGRSDALCPLCGIDAVLPNSEVVLTKEMLREMHDHWFSKRG